MFGVAAFALGLITLAWHDHNAWQRYIVYAASAAQILGGGAIQFRRTVKTGRAVLCAGYLVFVLLVLPGILS